MAQRTPAWTRTSQTLGAVAVAAALLAAPSWAQTPGTSEGPLEYAEGQAKGRFVEFRVDEGTGTVCDWTHQGTKVIEQIGWADMEADVEAQPGALRITEVHNRTADGTQNRTGDGANGAPCPRPVQAVDPLVGLLPGETAPDAPLPGPRTGPQAEPAPGRIATRDPGRPPYQPLDPMGLGDPSEALPSSLVLHDAPSGAIKAEARGQQTIQFSFDERMDVQEVDEWTVRVSGGATEAWLWVDHVRDDAGRNDLGALFVAQGQNVTFATEEFGILMFRVVDRDLAADIQVAEAFAEGTVLAEVFVGPQHELVFHSGLEDPLIAVDRSQERIDLELEVRLAPRGGPGNASGEEPPEDGAAPGRAVVVVAIDVLFFEAHDAVPLAIRVDGGRLPLVGLEDTFATDGEDRATVLVDDNGAVKVLANLGPGEQTLSLEAVVGAFGAEPEPTPPADRPDEPISGLAVPVLLAAAAVLLVMRRR